MIRQTECDTEHEYFIDELGLELHYYYDFDYFSRFMRLYHYWWEPKLRKDRVITMFVHPRTYKKLVKCWQQSSPETRYPNVVNDHIIYYTKPHNRDTIYIVETKKIRKGFYYLRHAPKNE